ncbi:unnamed protein product (macronuclear) [Paramecium tetraurelia]|uniref:C2 domain-containing protein n=1 Tax=Paramecium tetraurelia TaxID=5888 RepID=A0CZA0_PARTE|nr:uncharacterized protein GSPATT00011690001 [Paramecium tetraurelia]CAK76117.1 unnamed protein product [Paramecium tetraurelia]|eukprot:XP_001443514.1 hypothetical protein (macronuclear) [Paramecium tetraurelia strain d4-2]
MDILLPQTQGEIVYIYISARNLRNLDHSNILDFRCRVYLKDDFVGETEVSKSSLDPDFKQPIPIMYKFNKKQKLTFQIVDADQELSNQLITQSNQAALVGSCKQPLAKLMGARNSLSQLNLLKGDEIVGNIIIHVTKKGPQIIGQKQQGPKVTEIKWRWAGVKLLDLDFFTKSDPFAKFHSVNGDQIDLIHQTEIIKNNLNPNWMGWETTEEQAFKHSKQLYVEVMDYDKLGSQQIGHVTIDYNEIKNNKRAEFPLLTPKGKNAGTLKLVELAIIEPPIEAVEIVQEEPKDPTFLDYLMGGWQMSLTIGIDFTFSNQPITKPDSLHKIDPNKLNYYQQAMKVIGGEIVAFDYDKEVPVYGFGGTPKLPTYTKNTMDDCFPINGNKDNSNCQDIKGILEAYVSAVPQIVFSGPTFIANVLSKAHQFAVENAKQNIYTVAMILTDGQIEDQDDAIKVLLQCQNLPMSIVIIGVGDENFKYMKQFDDPKFLKKHAKENQTIRDIIQFVSFQDFKNDIEQMSSVVLDQLPKQFMDYMHVNNILPVKMSSVHIGKALQ